MKTSLITKDSSERGASLLASKEKRFSKAFRERRATPAFSSDPVDDEDLTKILRGRTGSAQQLQH